MSTQRLHRNFDAPRASWDAAVGERGHTPRRAGHPGYRQRRDRWPRGSRVGGVATMRSHLPDQRPPARHTSYAYQYPQQTAAEGRLVTSPSSRGVPEASEAPW